MKNLVYRISQKFDMLWHIPIFLKYLIYQIFLLKMENFGSLTSIRFFKTIVTYQIFRGSVKNMIVLIEGLIFYRQFCMVVIAPIILCGPE